MEVCEFKSPEFDDSALNFSNAISFIMHTMYVN